MCGLIGLSSLLEAIATYAAVAPAPSCAAGGAGGLTGQDTIRLSDEDWPDKRAKDNKHPCNGKATGSLIWLPTSLHTDCIGEYGLALGMANDLLCNPKI